ncbi:hypothetical protein TWF730_007593 [Orbilia blumenaviensis]|uniref:Uncharacterized protein n=1 Tax=Orbilia blumenaviensis TaxID=1796055 RepID=A0AAV9V9E8_9PEZI
MAATYLAGHPQFPLMSQSTTSYDMDPMAQQTFQAGFTGFLPTPGHAQQQVFLTSGQPVQVVAGPGGTIFPQMRIQNPNQGVFMQHPSANIMHLPFAGDVHAHTPQTYGEMDSRFQAPRSRRASFSVNFGAGQLGGYPGGPTGQMANPMDYVYMDNCMMCRAKHPPPHPHSDMQPMSNYRKMNMDDTMSNSSKMRGSVYPNEGPMCDPMDWNPGPRSRDRRDPAWDYRSKPSQVRSRSRSQAPPSRGGFGRVPFNGIQASEISDFESEDDTASRQGRVTNYGGPQRRSNSQRGQRSSSRSRPIHLSGSNNYM